MLNRSGDPEERRRQKEASRQEAAEKAKAAQREAAIATAKTQFFNSPAGLARTAKASGQRYFQIELSINATSRTWRSMAYGQVETKRSNATGQGAVLTEIEEEGWELIHAGFVFQETGQVSRDKFLSTGQSIQTTGQTFGVYLFRATDAALRTDEPWMSMAPAWAPDPFGRHELRYWDGSAWTQHVSDGGVQSINPPT